MYNPYDLVPMLINNQELTGRPIEYDSEVVDNNSMTNAFGHPVKPSKLSTVCPDCGQGLEFDVILGDPPFGVVAKICYHCNPAPPPQADPFMNPVDEGRIPVHELDPLLHDPGQQVISNDDSSVADRFQFDTVSPEESQEGPSEEVQESPKKSSKKQKTKATSAANKVKKKAKKRPSRAKKKPPSNKKAEVELAEGVGGEEVEFDDDDLIETE